MPFKPLAFIKRRKAPATSLPMNKTTIHALAALLFLAQLPHLLHLPFWVSVLGMSVVTLKLVESKYHQHRIIKLILSSGGMTLIAVGSALLIRLHFGYFMGRDPCVAFLFILVSAKFAEIRKPGDATLLLCLAGFLLLTQYFYSQSILSAIITLPAVAALGNALMVLRDPGNSRAFKSNLKVVGKLLIQGTPLALLLFVVFPRLPGPLWSLPDDAVAKTGLSDSMSPGTIGNLSQSDEVAFRVEFEGAIPHRNQRYWRGPVLSVFDGRSWTLAESQISVRPTTDRQAGIGYSVMLQPNKQKWLFALDYATSRPRSIAANANDSRVLATMTSDLQLLSRSAVTRVTRYAQRSSLSDRFVPVRRPSSLLTQTAGVNIRTIAFAKELREKSSSDTAYVQAVLNWFNQEKFHYTLQPSLLGSQPVDEFLFDTRTGFCEHYSSAFVVLMRAAGIPARVVTGYLGGEMNEDYMIVRQSDAHAWAEVFINGAWQRYDPTGAVAPSRVDSSLAAALADGEPLPLMARAGNDWLKRLRLNMDKMNHDWQRLVVDFNNESQLGFWKNIGLPRPQLWQITLIVIVISALWCLAVLGVPFIKRKNQSATDRLWERFVDTVNRYGVTRGAIEPPAEFVHRAASAAGRAQSDIAHIGTTLIQMRFEATSTSTRDENKPMQKQQRDLSRRLFWINLSSALWQSRFFRHLKV